MAASPTIAVTGAGIGGLTAALALARKGFRVVVLEREQILQETGAGLQLSPNASRILIDLGLKQTLTEKAFTPDAISVRSARTGDEIAAIPLGNAAGARYGAPYWLMYRPDLQAALFFHAASNPNIELRLGWRFENATPLSNGISVEQSNGNSRREDEVLALVGADGVWSAVRGALFPDVRPQFTGRIAWRGLIDPLFLPRSFDPKRVQLWLGPNAHLVAYPMAGTKRVNLVAIVNGEWNRPGWSEPGDASEVMHHFMTWPLPVRAMIESVAGWRKWALSAMPDGGEWRSGNVALLGDASHAMLPFVAQGAAMAIEDAAVLADCMADEPADVASAFARYESLRKPRVTAVQQTARKMGEIYHLTGLKALARDQAMRLLGGSLLLARNDWIYRWEP